MRIQTIRSGAFRVSRRKLWVQRLIFLSMYLSLPTCLSNSQVPQQNGAMPQPSPGAPKQVRNPYLDNLHVLDLSMQNPADQKRIAQLNSLRQREMTEDTARLLRLAKELKTETDQGSREDLSQGAVLKVELIEKLAHSVQDKMKATVTR